MSVHLFVNFSLNSLKTVVSSIFCLQVLQGNYYYNIGDHGGVLVAVKYFKTEGFTNEIMYSTDEGLNWKSHQFYPTPMR